MSTTEFERTAHQLIQEFAKTQLRKRAKLVPSHATEEWLLSLRKTYGDPQTSAFPASIFTIVIDRAVRSSPYADTDAAPHGWAWVPKSATHEWAQRIQSSDSEIEWPQTRDLMEIVQKLFELAPQHVEASQPQEAARQTITLLQEIPRSLLASSQQGAA
jgi:hypothetical protein